LNKHQLTALLAFFALAAIIAVLFYFGEKYGWLITTISIGILTMLFFLLLLARKKIRYSKLLAKYNDEELVRKIMRRTLWQGQTAEQVIDAIGEPKDIDQKVLKTKTKEVWKYFPSGRRRYGLRITLDNDEVVGWDEKI